MKSSIKFISTCLAVLSPIIFAASTCHALSPEHLLKYSIQEIEFYDEDNCSDTSTGGNCGNSAKEVYWSALSNTFGAVQAAGIFGNIMNEGGFNPVSVESCTSNNPFDFKSDTWRSGWSAEEYTEGNKTTGVGSFGITWERYKYFDFIEEKNGHDLIEKYFLHPEEYSFGGCSDLSVGSSETGGDALRAKIGDADYNRLVSIEVEYMLKMLSDSGYGFDMDKFKSLTTPEEAAEFFSMNYEKCEGCTTAGSAENQERKTAAKKAYDEMKDFACSSGGIFKGKGYNYSDEEIKRLAAAALSENGCSTQAMKTELSIMANLTEERGYDSIIEYIQLPVPPGFFAAKTGATYRGSEYQSVTEEQFQAAVDVIRNGNRTMPPGINEHDCLGDLSGIDFDGTGNYEQFTGGGCNGSARNVDTGRFKSGITKIKNVYGSEYTFYAFAGGDCGDPFGYTGDTPPAGTGASSGGSSSTSSSGGSSSPASKVTPAKITLIGDSISVMSEDAIKAKFPDGFLNMVGSRHPTSKGVCDGDEGGLSILEKLVKGSGSIVTQHSSGGCESVNVEASTLTNAVIWELGTNSVGATEETMKKVIELVGSNRKLYLVTPYDGVNKSSADGIADMYRKLANENDNVYVIDWNNAVSGNESQYIVQSDHVHPNEEGQKLFADLLSQASASTEVCASGTTVTAGNFEWYTQWEEPWKSVSFGNSTVGRAGCGPTSFAMMASILLGHAITPKDTAKVAVDTNSLYNGGSGGSLESVTKNLADHFNLEYDEKPWSSPQEAVDIINKYLDEGWMVHVSGAGSDPFTAGGHYIGIIGKSSSGKWLLANSAVTEDKRSKEYDPMGLVTAGLHYNIKAIRSSGNSAANCAGECGATAADSAGGLVSGGMNLEQAEAFMKQYKEMSMEDYNKALNDGTIYLSTLNCCPNCGDGKEALANCTVFSRWFVATQTTLDVGSANEHRGNGDQLAKVYHDDFNLPMGTEPRPYSIFSKHAGGQWSSYGHTGIVLGVDKENDKIIIGEAGCLFSSDAYTYTGAKEKPLSEWLTDVDYTYLDSVLKK